MAGLDLAKVREVPRWRESGAFTPLERDVLAYAEAMSQRDKAPRWAEHFGGLLPIDALRKIAAGSGA